MICNCLYRKLRRFTQPPSPKKKIRFRTLNVSNALQTYLNYRPDDQEVHATYLGPHSKAQYRLHILSKTTYYVIIYQRHNQFTYKIWEDESWNL